jgi:propane monooxygenase reductase subunit
MSEVTVKPFEHTFTCEDGESILDAALRSKVYLRYGCKHGGCGTCKVLLDDGDVDLTASSFALPPGEQDAGVVLVCQSYPTSDCVIDVEPMNLDEDEFFQGDQTGTYTVELESITTLAPDICGVRLRHVNGVRMPFIAGQFVNVTPNGTEHERSYSMSNGSADNDRVELICKLLPGGAFSRYLQENAQPGDALTITGPYGLMKVRLSHRDIVMVAGGSGLAPLLSMLKDLARKGSTRRVTLFFGARTQQDLYLLDEIEELQRALPSMEFIPVLTTPAGAEWAGATGLVTDALADHRDSYAGCDAYLCGPPGMIDAATELLVARGVRAQNVYFDAFVPTNAATIGG